jgi:hypothetical protein
LDLCSDCLVFDGLFVPASMHAHLELQLAHELSELIGRQARTCKITLSSPPTRWTLQQPDSQWILQQPPRSPADGNSYDALSAQSAPVTTRCLPVTTRCLPVRDAGVCVCVCVCVYPPCMELLGARAWLLPQFLERQAGAACWSPHQPRRLQADDQDDGRTDAFCHSNSRWVGC